MFWIDIFLHEASVMMRGETICLLSSVKKTDSTALKASGRWELFVDSGGFNGHLKRVWKFVVS